MQEQNDSSSIMVNDTLPLAQAIAEFERKYLVRKLRQAVGNQTDAARLSGIPVDTFHKKMKRYGIKLRVKEVEIYFDD